ncbi:hypothetical protein EV182_006408, partial [Spiromyces aspiralis]
APISVSQNNYLPNPVPIVHEISILRSPLPRAPSTRQQDVFTSWLPEQILAKSCHRRVNDGRALYIKPRPRPRPKVSWSTIDPAEEITKPGLARDQVKQLEQALQHYA